MNRNTAILAAAAGALFLASVPAHADEGMGGGGKDQVKCEGVNSCKGHSDCKTAHSDCAGKNSCKGKGFMLMTPEECKAAKEKLGKQD